VTQWSLAVWTQETDKLGIFFKRANFEQLGTAPIPVDGGPSVQFKRSGCQPRSSETHGRERGTPRGGRPARRRRHGKCCDGQAAEGASTPVAGSSTPVRGPSGWRAGRIRLRASTADYEGERGPAAAEAVGVTSHRLTAAGRLHFDL